MSEAHFARILEKGDVEAILALGERQLANPGPEGPSAFYYLGLWLDARLPERDSGTQASGEAAEEDIRANGERSELPPVLMELGGGRSGDSSDIGDLARVPRDLVADLYRLALRQAQGFAKKEAGRALLEELESAIAAGGLEADRHREGLLSAAAEYARRVGPDREMFSSVFSALEALGRDAELLREIAEARRLPPSDIEKAESELLYYEGAASLRLGRQDWEKAFARLFLTKPGSEWTKKAVALLETSTKADEFSAEALAAGRIRAAVFARDYSAGYRAAMRAPALILSETAQRSLVGDLGKCILYSGAANEGITLFEGFEGKVRERAGPEAVALAWTAAFYRARFLRVAERNEEAAALFERLAAIAPNPNDADAALFYAADSGIRLAGKTAEASIKGKSAAAETRKAALRRRLALAALARAAEKATKPSTFSEQGDELLRDGLQARDWLFVDEFARRLAGKLTHTLCARASYAAGRAAELGLYRPGPLESPSLARDDFYATDSNTAADASAEILKERAKLRFREAADYSEASQYYRLLASYRLGEEILLVPPEAPENLSPASGAEAEAEFEAFVAAFFRYGLGAEAWQFLRDRRSDLDADALRRLAEAFSEAGRHADSMRLILSLSERPDWAATRRDYELLYPRPFMDELRAARPKNPIDEWLFFGMLRSESFFRTEVVSSAGAVGLSQLMPATAADVARRLKMKTYDIRLPADNLKIGAAYFGDLLAENEGRPLRAMWAYNAGRGRLRKWLAESGDLPDDLLLESLAFEETRQYGRNILLATVWYGALYYGKSPRETTEETMGKDRPR